MGNDGSWVGFDDRSIAYNAGFERAFICQGVKGVLASILHLRKTWSRRSLAYGSGFSFHDNHDNHDLDTSSCKEIHYTKIGIVPPAP